MTEQEFDKQLFRLPILSIQQPWAWVIVNGLKDIENRDWPTKFRGYFLVHAGKKRDNSNISWIENKIGMKIPSDLPLGGIVGGSKIIDCVKQSNSPWFMGDYGFVLDTSASKPLPFYPCRGKLGFFKLELGNE